MELPVSVTPGINTSVLSLFNREKEHQYAFGPLIMVKKEPT